VQAFTVAENIHLGWSETPRRASATQLEARTRALAERFNLEIRPDARVNELSAGEQQRVEILRVLARQARVLILDEPTAVLTPSEARELFKALREFRARGNAVIFISHKLDEVIEISDRISVLRGGRKVATLDAAGSTHGMLAQLMVGREIVIGNYRKLAVETAGSRKSVLTLKGVSALDDNDRIALNEINLDVRTGEILGIAGVAGNGQRELSQVLTGLRPIASGKVLIDDTEVRSLDPSTFAGLGIGHIPEDRLRDGVAGALSISDNAVLREYRTEPVSHGPLFSPRAAGQLARTIASAAEVAVPDFGMPLRNLSGGNQQRLVARREMRIASRLLVAAYPNRGLDVGATNTMFRYFVELREASVAVVLISEELEELLNLSDRIAVLFEGRIMGTFKTEEADMETIGLLMGGRKQPAPAPASSQ